MESSGGTTKGNINFSGGEKVSVLVTLIGVTVKSFSLFSGIDLESNPASNKTGNWARLTIFITDSFFDQTLSR
mgnify:CR=1 FL=1